MVETKLSSGFVLAPANIAWVKYMGKGMDGRGLNPSISATLNRLGTRTKASFICAPQTEHLQIRWAPESYFLSLSAKQKAESFLNSARGNAISMLSRFGFQPVTAGLMEIQTKNTIPHGAGLASSASGFAALTTAALSVWSQDPNRFREMFEQNFEFKKAVARISRLGSGSSIRSFFGPWVFWDPNGDELELLTDRDYDLVDLVVLFSKSEKLVSSSEAHRRVKSSPNFEARMKRLPETTSKIQQAIRSGNLQTVQRLVWEEALDMHELFHTSVPAFRYLTVQSMDLIRYLQDQQGFLTIDAGPNLHWFVKRDQVSHWMERLRRFDGVVDVLADDLGKGVSWE